MKIPTFKTDNELFKFLKENEDTIIYNKKQAIKNSDVLTVQAMPINKGIHTKADDQDGTAIKVRAIINTTNVIDSHNDMHVKGIWDKSVAENKNIKYLQEHKMSFDSIIADKEDLEVTIETMPWKSLGFDIKGSTQALVFNATIKEERNPFMHKQFSAGNVDNNSVGMRYINIKMAFNSEEPDWEIEKEVWDKYYPLAVNPDESIKHFFVVTAAKAIEGSAVPLGSNHFTPVLQGKRKDIVTLTDSEKQTQAIKKWLES